MRKDFRSRLKDGPILCDGAMGTLLDRYGHPELPHDLQNIIQPSAVERIHREYIEAGSEIIQTNTFSANRYRLSQYHLAEKLKEINRAGVLIARRAAGDDVYVAGSVGPLGTLLEPLGKVTLERAREAFREQIHVLVDAGVDLLILETFVSLTELDQAIAAAKSLTDLPIVAQKTFPEDGSILAGTFPLEVVEHLLQRGVDVVGANCTVGPQRMFNIIRTMYKDGVTLSAQPAAGIPMLLDGRSTYHASPEYLAEYASELLHAGVTLIGACCGSTPEHIRAMREVLNSRDAGGKVGRAPSDQQRPHISVRGETGVKPGDGPKTDEARAGPRQLSRFGSGVGKRFLSTVELDIPRGLDMSPVLEGARHLHAAGVDAVNITDGARARLRMSPIAISSKIQSEAGIEAITHLTTRDRNMISLQSELMSAHAFGLKNILCITGDPTNIGDYPQATSVFDIDSSGLIRAAKSMNEGMDLMGNSIEQRTSFFVACAVNPRADNPEAEFLKLKKKIDAGADIVFSQPMYDMQTLESLLDRIHDWNIPLMMGLLPLRSYRHAEFLHNEIPGMVIPEGVRRRMRDAGDGGAAVGIELAVGFLREAKPLISGVYLMPPFRKHEVATEVLRGAGVTLHRPTSGEAR